MEFQDQEIVCSDCATPFTFSGAEQEFYEEKGFTHPPKRCKPCRAARKNQARGNRRGSSPARQGAVSDAGGPLFKADFGPSPEGRAPHHGPRKGRGPGGRGRGPGPGGERPGRRPVHLFDAVCSDCASPTQVPFRPNGTQPVYCRACLPKYKAQRARNRAAGGPGPGDAQA